MFQSSPDKRGSQTESIGGNNNNNKYGFKEEAASQQADRYGTIGSIASADQQTPAAAPGGPILPPKIDRQKKPHKKSASERLFGGRSQQTPPEEEPPPAMTNGNSSGGGYAAAGGLLTQAANSNSFDPTANPNPSSLVGYDSYNKRQEMAGYSSVNGPAAAVPYSRSLSQPPQTAIQTNGSLQASAAAAGNGLLGAALRVGAPRRLGDERGEVEVGREDGEPVGGEQQPADTLGHKLHADGSGQTARSQQPANTQAGRRVRVPS